jgi:hypothetical protein
MKPASSSHAGMTNPEHHPLHNNRVAGTSGGFHPDSLMDRNAQFERLISGQVTESGEAPPPYISATTRR